MRAADQLARSARAGIRLGHEALADQERVIAGRGQRVDVGAAADAALGRPPTTPGPSVARRAPSATSSDTASVLRLRLFTPIDVAPACCARASSSARVHLDQRRQAHAPRPRRAAARSVASSSAATISRTRRRRRRAPRGSGYSSTMKSLRRTAVDRGAHRAQMIERAVEERRLGQHRDRRRAGRARTAAAIATGS